MKKALDADNFSEFDKYFIAPAELNKIIICEDGKDWEGGYFPFSED